MTIPPDFPVSQPRFNARALKVTRWVVGSLLLSAVLGVAITAIVIGLRERSLSQPIAGGVQTTGRVVNVVVQDDRSTSYAPIIEFTDETGHTVRFKAPYSSDEPAIATPATVSYDPRNPKHAHDLSEEGATWQGGPIIAGVGIIGFIVFLAPIAMWIQYMSRKAFQVGPTSRRR